MVVGFTATVLIGYNGIIDKPGRGPAEIGVSLDYGYWSRCCARSRSRSPASCARSRAAAGETRKAPGTV